MLDNSDTIQPGDQWLHQDGETWETYQPKDNSIGENWKTGVRYNRGLFLPFRRPLCSCPNVPTVATEGAGESPTEAAQLSSKD